MDIAGIVLSSISGAIAIASFVWAIVNDKRNRKMTKTVALLQCKIDKSNHVSKIVFDKIFSQFQELSDCLFENYNNAIVRLFPMIEQVICFLPTKEEKISKMVEYYQKSNSDLNNLIKLIQTNRFILTVEMLSKLEQFEKQMREMLSWYDDKIRDVANGSNIKIISREQELELTKKADDTLTLYNDIEDCFKQYINDLQIVE